MSTLEEILSKQAKDIEAPKPYPVGTYVCLVDGVPTLEKVGKNQTDAFIFNTKIVQPIEVDQTAMAEFGAIAGKPLRQTFFVTEDAIYRLKTFLVDSLGIDDTLSIKAMIPQAMGKQFIATVGHRASEDGTRIYSEVKGTAHV